MLIKIDTREKDLYNLCKLETDNISFETLAIGDIIICDDENVEKVIIERKTLYDLASSIKDGRYAEQSYRLDNCELHNHNIIYLIEGNLERYNPKRGRLEKRALVSAFTTLMYYKGFSLYKTDNISETADFIINCANKLQKTKKGSYYELDNKEKVNYVDVSSRVKKNNITQNNIGAIMLSQIPNVSSAIALSVMKEHETIGKLIEALRENSKILENITIETKGGKLRKISKTSTANIYNYLLPDSQCEISVVTD